MKSRIFVTLIALVFVGLMPACDKTTSPIPTSGAQEDTYIQMSVPTSRIGNGVALTNEDKIHQLRLILTTPADGGKIVINRMVAVVNGPNAVAAGWHSITEALQIIPATYNVYVVANEASVPGLTAAISSVDTEAQLLTDPRLKALAFNKDFVPTDDKGIVMTGQKAELVVTPGYPQTAPQRVSIDLLRTCAKLSFTISRTAAAETKKLTIKSITVEGMPSAFSLFPQTDPAYSFAGDLITNYLWDFSADPIVAMGQTKTAYMPEFLFRTDVGKRKMIVTVQREGTTDVMTHEIVLHDKANSLTDANRYNFDRNQHYHLNIKIRDWADIAVEFNVLDWTSQPLEYIYVGEHFNIRIPQQPANGIITQMTIQTSKPTVELPPQHQITVRRIDGASTIGNAAEQMFADRQYGAYVTYDCSFGAGDAEGKHFEVLYNGRSLVKF